MPRSRDTTMLKADATKVRIALAERCWNIKTTAEKAGVSPNTVSNMAAGKYIKPERFGMVAKALGKPIEALMEELCQS